MPTCPPQLSGFHHLAVICSDYARSKAFYTQVLGLEVIAETFRQERDSWKLDLALPCGGQIELFTFPGAPNRPSRPEAQGARHLALGVSDLRAWREWLEGQGIPVEPTRIDPLTGAAFTFFADPDGLPIELVETSTPVEPPKHRFDRP